MSSPEGGGKNSLAYDCTRGCRCSCVARCSIAALRPTVVSSACAVSRVAPGASTPKMVTPGPERGAWFNISARNGVHTSCATGNSKPSRMTPTTVACSLPSCTLRPSTLGSLPKRVRHTS